MSDLINRLREGCGCNFPETTCMAEDECRDAFEAAAEIERLTAALAEARGLLGAFYRADIDPHKYDRTAQWLERNP